MTRQEDVYFALRQTLVSRHDELELFDRAFVAWFLRGPVAPLVREKQRRKLADRIEATLGSDAGGDDAEVVGEPIELGASAHELLREKDFAEMTAEEFERARRLLLAIARSRPRRTSRRLIPDPRGDRLDMRRLIRRSLRTGGDPVDQPWKAAQGGPPQARRPLRRVRLDGRLRACAAAVPPRARRQRARRRGVRLRDQADAPHRRPRHARSGERARPRHGERRRLGERDSDRRVAEGVQRPLRPPRPLARRRRRDRLGRLGA